MERERERERKKKKEKPGDHSYLRNLIVTASSDKLTSWEKLISGSKGNAQITGRERKSYLREDLSKLEQINTLKFVTAAQPKELSLKGLREAG